MSEERKYFLIPYDEITDEMVEKSYQTSRETIRKSIQPIKKGERENSPKAYFAIVSFSSAFDYRKKFPILNNYKALSAEECRQEIDNSDDWSFEKKLMGLAQKFNLEKVLKTFDEGYKYESICNIYYNLFEVLKINFFIGCFDYIKFDIEKYKKFNSKEIGNKNESSLATVCWFYNYISKEQYDIINSFRSLRNNYIHEKEFKIGKVKKSEAEVRRILEKTGKVTEELFEYWG